MIRTRTKERPTSDKYRNDRTVKLPCRYTNNRAEKVVEKKRKGLRQVGKRGVLNLFMNQVLELFFIKSGIERTCHVCYGRNYCGDIDRAHSKRRPEINIEDWWSIFRVLPAGRNCHFAIDKRGRRRAERLIERFIKRMFRAVDMDDRAIKELLIECADEIQELDAQSKRPRFMHFDVTFQDPRPYPINLDEVGTDGKKVWTVTEE